MFFYNLGTRCEHFVFRRAKETFKTKFLQLQNKHTNSATIDSFLFAAFEAANFQIDFFGNPVMRTAD